VTLEDVGSASIRLATPQGVFSLPRTGVTAARGASLSLGLRPEALTLINDGEAAFGGKVLLVERLGGETFAYVALEAIDAQPVIVRLDGDHAVAPQDLVRLGFDPGRAHLFGQDGQALGQPGPDAAAEA
jgi:multiple sugar transport system ATP-binding protein